MSIHSYKIDSKYSEVTSLMSNLRELFVANNISRDDYNEIEMCLVESMNNVVRHSYNGKEGFHITLNIELTNTDIILSIIDVGIPRTNFEKPILDYDPEDIENLPEGGMGLFIIDQLMDSTSYKTNGNENIFSMKKKLRV